MEEEGKKEEVAKEKKAEKEKPLEKMTAKDLREIALGIPDISGVHAMKKEQLLEVIKEAKGKEEQEKEKPLEKMTAKDLREIAREIPGVSGVHAMKKEQLLEVVKEAKGGEEEKPVKTRRKKALKKEVSVRELKQKIIQFKEKKEAARRAKDSKTIDILRRRINRLKKRTRKAAQA